MTVTSVAGVVVEIDGLPQASKHKGTVRSTVLININLINKSVYTVTDRCCAAKPHKMCFIAISVLNFVIVWLRVYIPIFEYLAYFLLLFLQ